MMYRLFKYGGLLKLSLIRNKVRAGRGSSYVSSTSGSKSIGFFIQSSFYFAHAVRMQSIVMLTILGPRKMEIARVL